MLRVFDTQIRETLVRERVMATLSGVFGTIAGLLAAIGLYGIVSYTVERRRREIGIRLALGASRGTIVGSVLKQSGVWVAVGLVLGVIASFAVTRTAQSLLYGVQSHDPATHRRRRRRPRADRAARQLRAGASSREGRPDVDPEGRMT